MPRVLPTITEFITRLCMSRAPGLRPFDAPFLCQAENPSLFSTSNMSVSHTVPSATAATTP